MGKTYAKGEVAGVVESVKAAADVYMPIAGEVTEVNEELRADPPRAFHELLRAIGEKEIDDAVFGPALDFSDFRNMRKREAAGEFGSKILQPRDCEDPETFKVRQGKVGSFREYLSDQDQGYAAQVCAALNPRFGYDFRSGNPAAG